MRSRNRFWTALVGIAAGAVGMALWRQWQLEERQPSPAEVDAYLDWYFEFRGVPGLRREMGSDYVVSDGLRLHLDLLESKPGDPAVVFVPGTGMYAAIYGEFMHKLRLAGFNVIGLDPRGHGRSEGQRGSYTVNELVRDAQAAITYAIEHYGERVAIAGSSQGGITAFYAAAADPRIRAAVCHNLALLHEPGIFTVSRYPELLRMAYPLLAEIARRVPELKIPIWLYLHEDRLGRSSLGDIKDVYRQTPLAIDRVALKAMISLASTPPARPPEEVTTPILVVHAERDALFSREYIGSIYNRLGGPKELVIVPEAEHLVWMEQVDASIPPVVEWLQQTLKK